MKFCLTALEIGYFANHHFLGNFRLGKREEEKKKKNRDILILHTFSLKASKGRMRRRE